MLGRQNIEARIALADLVPHLEIIFGPRCELLEQAQLPSTLFQALRILIIQLRRVTHSEQKDCFQDVSIPTNSLPQIRARVAQHRTSATTSLPRSHELKPLPSPQRNPPIRRSQSAKRIKFQPRHPQSQACRSRAERRMACAEFRP